jgi:hypothetical protein
MLLRAFNICFMTMIGARAHHEAPGCLQDTFLVAPKECAMQRPAKVARGLPGLTHGGPPSSSTTHHTHASPLQQLPQLSMHSASTEFPGISLPPPSLQQQQQQSICEADVLALEQLLRSRSAHSQPGAFQVQPASQQQQVSQLLAVLQQQSFCAGPNANAGGAGVSAEQARAQAVQTLLQQQLQQQQQHQQPSQQPEQQASWGLGQQAPAGGAGWRVAARPPAPQLVDELSRTWRGDTIDSLVKRGVGPHSRQFSHKRVLEVALEGERQHNPQLANELRTMIQRLNKQHEAAQRYMGHVSGPEPAQGKPDSAPAGSESGQGLHASVHSQHRPAAQQPISDDAFAALLSSISQQQAPQAPNAPVNQLGSTQTSDKPQWQQQPQQQLAGQTRTISQVPSRPANTPGAPEPPSVGASSAAIMQRSGEAWPQAGAAAQARSTPAGATHEERVQQLRAHLLRELAHFKSAPHTAQQGQTMADIVAKAVQQLCSEEATPARAFGAAGAVSADQEQTNRLVSSLQGQGSGAASAAGSAAQAPAKKT